ncbi:MAG: hypothetical protein RLZZ172_1974 [Bacteroidota bacterium]
MTNLNTKPSTFSAKITTTLLFFVIATAVFAVDGIVIRSKSSKASFSNMKKNITLSLNAGFSYRDNKSFGFKKTGAANSFNSVITYQKGNVKYVIPYKHKAILDKFKTPQKPQQ